MNDTTTNKTREHYLRLRAEAIEAMRTGDESWNAGRASAWEDAAIHAKHWSGEELASRLRASVERLEGTLETETDYEEREWLEGRLGSMQAAITWIGRS